MKPKVVLISGCSRGLGKMLVENLAKKKCETYAGIRDLEKAKELISSWKKELPNIKPVKLDVTSDADCEKVVRAIYKKEKKLDVLINVVGYSKAGPLEQFSVEDYKDILDTNAIGAFRLLRQIVPFMKKHRSGKIINVTSLNGLLALPNFGIYCSSKFALEALGLSLRYEMARNNVWVTNVEPGAIYNKDESSVGLPHTSARERFWFLRKFLPMIKAEEVAKAIEKLMENPSPPAQVILGADASVTTFLQKYLPGFIWDKLLIYVWSRQNKQV